MILLVEYRKSLHRRLALDMTKPYFRRGNTIRFQNDCVKEKYLINPHESVINPESKINLYKHLVFILLILMLELTNFKSFTLSTDCEISLVSGLYAYYHYMQDLINDQGWGCAYRSLQTIVSWFRYIIYLKV
jgi:hypothetical protein